MDGLDRIVFGELGDWVMTKDEVMLGLFRERGGGIGAAKASLEKGCDIVGLLGRILLGGSQAYESITPAILNSFWPSNLRREMTVQRWSAG